MQLSEVLAREHENPSVIPPRSYRKNLAVMTPTGHSYAGENTDGQNPGARWPAIQAQFVSEYQAKGETMSQGIGIDVTGE